MQMFNAGTPAAGIFGKNHVRRKARRKTDLPPVEEFESDFVTYLDRLQHKADENAEVESA
ncbi:MAG: hypothetical protein R3E02_05430 [Blastomonas sp.]